MSQSTKVFVVLAFMFLIFSTLKGTLHRYINIIIGE